MKDSDEPLAVKTATLYYENDMTQEEIATVLNLTRWKVGRLIAMARTAGIVKIEIVHPKARRLLLERKLRDCFELKDAVVVPCLDEDDPRALQSRVALAAAEYLTCLRPVPHTLGVSWGHTLHDVASHLRQGWATGVNVVQVNGGVSLNRRASSASNIAGEIARKAGGMATLLPSPAILEQVSTKVAIESDRTVAQILELGRSASAYLYSAGLVGTSSVLVSSGYLSDADMKLLVSKGAVGDVLGRFIDADGNVVDPLLDQRTVGLELDDIRAAKTAIAVIAGSTKKDICRTVVASGLCTVLITDEYNARYVMQDAG